MITRDIVLCAVPYKMTELDGQVIFLNRSGFAFCHSQFTFEWNGVGWDLVDTEGEPKAGIYVPHIVAAYKWVNQHYKREYDNGTAKVHFTDEILNNPTY